MAPSPSEAAPRALALGMVALLLVSCARDDPPFAELRQRSEQEIPGSLGYTLVPPPEDARPVIGPNSATARYPAPGAEVSIALASIRDTFEDAVYGPAWILFARGVCLRNAKGELVSAARGGQARELLACTDDTIWVLAVDTTTGEPLVALTAYDATRSWGPDVAAEP